ncbi:RNA polymerase sigma factor [Streptomyces sp. TLI_171]|uniref:RNA polymerase sigma factor n=1 Tax=Streptomyces sp. TLI_171 TaxID=1938859 RepID=UPI000C19AF3B|nr:sigma-70 family RNA polymerase sigma factor [Streptomyces sp. TLI_171]RKE22837.1 RNA polymerase sigma-70 factor (ECF subfamily) [Streptomyces sp. TLI_171]
MEDGTAAGLVRRAQRGDLLARDELLTLLTPHVARICAPIARQDAADATQETLLAVLRNLRQLRAPEALFGWVKAIAVRESVRVAARAGRTPPVDPATADGASGPSDPQLAADLRDVVARLPPAHRAVLTLRHLEDLDERTVAALLDLPVGTVRSRLHRARALLRRAWSSPEG